MTLLLSCFNTFICLSLLFSDHILSFSYLMLCLFLLLFLSSSFKRFICRFEDEFIRSSLAIDRHALINVLNLTLIKRELRFRFRTSHDNSAIYQLMSSFSNAFVAFFLSSIVWDSRSPRRCECWIDIQYSGNEFDQRKVIDNTNHRAPILAASSENMNSSRETKYSFRNGTFDIFMSAFWLRGLKAQRRHRLLLGADCEKRWCHFDEFIVSKSSVASWLLESEISESQLNSSLRTNENHYNK